MPICTMRKWFGGFNHLRILLSFSKWSFSVPTARTAESCVKSRGTTSDDLRPRSLFREEFIVQFSGGWGNSDGDGVTQDLEPANRFGSYDSESDSHFDTFKGNSLIGEGLWMMLDLGFGENRIFCALWERIGDAVFDWISTWPLHLRMGFRYFPFCWQFPLKVDNPIESCLKGGVPPWTGPLTRIILFRRIYIRLATRLWVM